MASVISWQKTAADMDAKCAEVLAQIALCAPGANAVTKSIYI